MCDPLTIAGIALTAGSTIANSMASQRVNAAREQALGAERTRQNALDQEAEALNLTSQDRYKGFAPQQDARAGTLGDYFKGSTIAEPVPGAMPASSSELVTREEAAQRGAARAMTDQSGDALGRLRAFGDLLAQTGRAQARDASLIGQIGGFKSGSSNVLPLELDQASQAGDGLKTLGDLLGGFGQVGLTAGLSGGTLPFLSKGKAPGIIPGIGSYTAATKAAPRLGGI